MPVDAPALLLIANFGSELVATAGAMALNVRAGGRTHALVLVTSGLRTRERAREGLAKVAAAIGCTLEFAGTDYHGVDTGAEQKRRIVKTLREFRPDVVLMQDPEHAWHDLDPSRRTGMMLTLEALALAGRDFAAEDLPGLEPCPVPTIYYLWPERPNCVLDVSPVWAIKEQAGECIAYQHEGALPILEGMYTAQRLAGLLPGYAEAGDYRKGLLFHQARERAVAIHHGLGGHGAVALAEVYRREGPFPVRGLTRA